MAVCIFHFDLFVYGVTGVDLFFMISGFVIYMSIINARSIGDFWFSRVIRLYPAYWLSIIIAIPCYTILSHQVISHQLNFIAGNFTMLQPVFRCGYLVQAYWTLYIEINFYVLISLLWRFKLFKHIELTIFIGLVLIATIIPAYQLFGDSSPAYTRFFIITRSLFPLICHFHLFAAGIVFYLIYTKGMNYIRLSLLLFSFVLIALTHSIGGKAQFYLNNTEHLICCFVYYLLFFLVIYNKAAILKHPLLVELGNLSFVLYLIHQCLGTSISDYLVPSVGPVISKTIGISASLIASYLITHYYDIPLRGWLKKVYKPQIKQPIAVLKS